MASFTMLCNTLALIVLREKSKDETSKIDIFISCIYIHNGMYSKSYIMHDIYGFGNTL